MRRPHFLIFILLLTGCASPQAIDGTQQSSAISSASTSSRFQYPLSQAQERVTKKPFGIQVSPSSSPVSPERFSGYHTGVDFETFPEEQDSDVPVTAICSGPVRFHRWVKGYGGVLIQDCSSEEKPVTVLYGHLNIDSVSANVGSTLEAGASVGILGKGFSEQTDGERKHLHLGVHTGRIVDLRGYVSMKEELEKWMDPFPVQK